ncbi:MAG: AMP-binding protein [Myxococcota bacterium]
MFQVKLRESYFPAVESEPVLETTVGGVLRDAAAAAPDHVGLIGVAEGGERRRWTYAEMLDEAEQIARALRSRFEPGERVAIWAPNIPEWVLFEFGAALAGTTLVTVNPAFRPSELEYVLSQSRASALYLVPEFRGNDMRGALEEVRSGLPELREVVYLDDWDEVRRAGATELPDVSPGDAVQIQYTSGTTGFPKGALLHHRGLTNNARLCCQRLGVRHDDVWLNFMPMFHTAGCAVTTLGLVQAHATQVIMPLFDPGWALDLVEEERATLLLAVPTMLVALLENLSVSERDLSSLRAVLSGASTVPAELVKRTREEMGVQFEIVYGQTECSPVMTQTWADDSLEDATQTIGQPLPRTEAAILAPETHEVVALGEIGEICTRGYHVMTGYYDMPEATVEAIDAEGWLHTGDLGSMDERGYLKITGRTKDMIIRGGENIYPREIEDVLFEHPSVAEVAVVGIPDERWGETVAAFVRPAAGESLQEADLFAYCRGHLSPQKTPRQWVGLDEFPLTPSGKIQKFILRDRFVAGEYEIRRV